MLVLIYTCQNTTLLEITCHGSFDIFVKSIHKMCQIARLLCLRTSVSPLVFCYPLLYKVDFSHDISFIILNLHVTL